jgi:hypothetical protein
MKLLRPSRPRGGILVFALMCSAVAVLGLTYWIMAVAGRSRYVDTLQASAKRRLARDNGRVLATRYVHARVLPAAAGGTFSRGFGEYYSGLQNYEWGGVSLALAWSGSPLASNTGSTGVNRISYGDRYGFGLTDALGNGLDLPLNILDGDDAWTYRWQARSYSPVLSGDLLVVHVPDADSSAASTTITGVVNVNGRAYFHNASENAGATPGDAVVFRAYGSPGPGWGALAPTDAMVTNYPPISTLAWAVAGAALPGVSNVVWDTATPGNSLRNKVLDTRTIPAIYTVDGATSSTSSNGYSSDGLGTVTVDLTNPTLDGVVVQNVQTIEFVGQATDTTWADVAGYPTALVVVHRSATDTFVPTTFNFRNKNNRRLAVGVRCETDPAPVTLNFPEADQAIAGVGPNWRLVLMLEQTPVIFAPAGGTLNITGGITTDRGFTAPGSPGALNLYRETSPIGLSTKTGRRSWAEGFRAD